MYTKKRKASQVSDCARKTTRLPDWDCCERKPPAAGSCNHPSNLKTYHSATHYYIHTACSTYCYIAYPGICWHICKLENRDGWVWSFVLRLSICIIIINRKEFSSKLSSVPVLTQSALACLSLYRYVSCIRQREESLRVQAYEYSGRETQTTRDPEYQQ